MNPEKHRDYLPDELAEDNEPESTPYLPEGVDRIIIRELEPGAWLALWERGGVNDAPMGEFTGTRGAAIAWAREHTHNILIFDPEGGDLVPLPASAT